VKSICPQCTPCSSPWYPLEFGDYYPDRDPDPDPVSTLKLVDKSFKDNNLQLNCAKSCEVIFVVWDEETAPRSAVGPRNHLTRETRDSRYQSEEWLVSHRAHQLSKCMSMLAHSMSDCELQSIYLSVVVAGLFVNTFVLWQINFVLYAASGWHGLTKASDRRCINDLLERAEWYQYCPSELPTFDELCEKSWRAAV